MKGLCVLGATGSIGVSTLDVAARHSHLYKVIALTANNNIDLLFEQCLVHHPEYVVVVNDINAAAFSKKLINTPIKREQITGFEADKVAPPVAPEPARAPRPPRNTNQQRHSKPAR